MASQSFSEPDKLMGKRGTLEPIAALRRRFLVLVAITLVLSTASFLVLRSWGLTLLQGQLESLARGTSRAWQVRLDDNIEAMRTLGQYYSGHPVSPDDFRTQVATTIDRHPEIEFITWLPGRAALREPSPTSAVELPDALAVRRPTATPTPGPNARPATPTRDSASASGAVSGINLSFTAADRIAMSTAAEDGEPIIAAASRTTQPGSRFTCYIYCPVYNTTKPGGKNRRLTGFLLGAVHLGRMTGSALQGLERADLELSFYQGQTPEFANLLYTYQVWPQRDISGLAALANMELPTDLKWGGGFLKAGRQWYFLCRPASRDFATSRMWMGRMVFFASLIFITILGVNLYVALNRTVQFEQLVTQRTAELQKEVAERQQAETQLREFAAQLEQSHFELERLNEMAELLQACHSFDEAGAVVALVAGDLFRDSTGAAYLRGADNEFKLVTHWGLASPPPATVDSESCWALRARKPHRSNPDSAAPRCTHLAVPSPDEYVCLPMMVQDHVHGLLHLTATADAAQTAAQQRFAQTVAEQLALALQRLEMQDTLRELSIRDPLTQLFNRRYLEETLQRETSRAMRGRRALSVIMLDIDHFKRFNDTYGHSAGDTLLRELGSFLSNNIRREDIACRYGGEEFTLILPDATPEMAEARATALRTAAEKLRISHQGKPLGGITLSLGVAAYPEHGDAAEDLLRAADAALYRAKAAGRNRVAIATPTDRNAGAIAPDGPAAIDLTHNNFLPSTKEEEA